LGLTPFEKQDDRETFNHAMSLFAENQGRYLITAPFDSHAIEAQARHYGVGVCFIGWTGGDTIALCRGGTEAIYPEIPLADLRAANERFFAEWMER